MSFCSFGIFAKYEWTFMPYSYDLTSLFFVLFLQLCILSSYVHMRVCLLLIFKAVIVHSFDIWKRFFFTIWCSDIFYNGYIASFCDFLKRLFVLRKLPLEMEVLACSKRTRSIYQKQHPARRTSLLHLMYKYPSCWVITYIKPKCLLILVVYVYSLYFSLSLTMHFLIEEQQKC